MRTLSLRSLLTILALAAATSTSCVVGTNFRGPGYDPQRGVIAPGAGEQVVMSLTTATLHSAKRDAFDEHIDTIMGSMDEQPGLIGWSMRTRALGNEVWTMSIWENEDAFLEFVVSDLHENARQAGLPAIKTFRSDYFPIETAEVPVSWDRALAMWDARKSQD